jgi:hypothetical protein
MAMKAKKRKRREWTKEEVREPKNRMRQGVRLVQGLLVVGTSSRCSRSPTRLKFLSSWHASDSEAFARNSEGPQVLSETGWAHLGHRMRIDRVD